MKYPWLAKTWDEYLKSRSAQRLHHGILLTGVEGVGKLELGKEIANHLLCVAGGTKPCGKCKGCYLIEAGTHPDYHQLSPEKSIGIEQVRTAINKLTQSAQLSGNKVLLVVQAELMTESAANALLKTLEEPTANTYIILVTSKGHQLLPTIISRCSKFVVECPANQEIKEWLSELSYPDVSDKLISLAAGSPLKSLKLLEQGGDGYSQFIDSLKSMLMNQITVKQFVEKQLTGNDNGLNWLQHWLLQGAKKKKSHYIKSLGDCQRSLVNLQRSGANKALILSSLCSEIKSNLVREQ